MNSESTKSSLKLKIYTEINVLLWLRTDIPESFPDVVTHTIEPKESGH
jgi:hypothetical protein